MLSPHWILNLYETGILELHTMKLACVGILESHMYEVSVGSFAMLQDFGAKKALGVNLCLIND